jgi:hypothetical protein
MKSLAIILCILIASPALPAQTLPMELNIVVVEGEGAVNPVRQRVKRDPLVRVEDENHKSVTGAVVVFTLPTSGATGEFGNGSKTLTITTDRNGMAAAQGLKMNYVAGKVPIHINASYRGLTARASIIQSSVLPPGEKPSKGGGHGALIAVLVVLGAAAGGGGAYLATRQKNTAASAPAAPSGPVPIGITPGTGTIAGGR